MTSVFLRKQRTISGYLFKYVHTTNYISLFGKKWRKYSPFSKEIALFNKNLLQLRRVGEVFAEKEVAEREISKPTLPTDRKLPQFHANLCSHVWFSEKAESSFRVAFL